MTIDQSKVKTWLQEEGVFFQNQLGEGLVAGWLIKVPIDIQQSINLTVGIASGKEDQLHVVMTIIPGQESQQIFKELVEEKKKELVRSLMEEFLRTHDTLPVISLHPDGRLMITLSAAIFEDSPLTKGRLMRAIRHLRNVFVYCDLFGPRLFRQYSSANELLKP